MIDYHIHSNFSPDSNSSVEDIVKYAREKNLKVIITDHYEAVEKDHNFKFDVKSYKETMKKYGLLVGVEFGWDGKSKIDIDLKEFDFVILSYHAYKEYDDIQKMYENYLKDLYNIIEVVNDFHVLGHLDFPRRFVKNNEPFSKKLYPLISEIFKKIIKEGKILEVNTSAIYRYGEPNPSYDILKLYRDLGGKYVTIGSDAHRLEDVGRGIYDTLGNLKDLGFEYIMVLNDGKWDMEKIV